ncbi:hypothetical protein FGIG_06816 [Fasciola gigantica]|uniref:N-acetylgalactosaminide beta-1,3-galactosyltransferase n=1 Tax=Fasciola gigantica TaxID=46835 RepID=A0A504YEH3_FASGI|nr:hypothetical protein FGIG_06816 [Fasciola gigantica]
MYASKNAKIQSYQKIAFNADYNQTKPDAYRNLWAKMMDAYKALYREADQYDYVFKADDDTYAIYENLEALVGKFSPEDLIQTGRLMRDRKSPQFFSGGSGYVLSRASLKAFVSRGILTHDRPLQCNSRNGPEDTRLADCARAIGVAQLNCLEHNRTELFFNREPEYLVSGRRLHFDRLNKGQLDWVSQVETEKQIRIFKTPLPHFSLRFLLVRVDTRGI